MTERACIEGECVDLRLGFQVSSLYGEVRCYENTETDIESEKQYNSAKAPRKLLIGGVYNNAVMS